MRIVCGNRTHQEFLLASQSGLGIRLGGGLGMRLGGGLGPTCSYSYIQQSDDDGN